MLAFHQSLFAPALPRLSGRLRKGRFEGIELAAAVEITLELRDMRELAIIAAHLVKDLLEDGQKCIDIRLRDHIRLLVYIEQDRPGRDRHCLAQGPRQHRVARELALKYLDGVLPLDLVVLQQKSEHLQQVRLT